MTPRPAVPAPGTTYTYERLCADIEALHSAIHTSQSQGALERLEIALPVLHGALEAISGRECERFTDDDPRECVETRREPCLRCVALAAILKVERIGRGRP